MKSEAFEPISKFPMNGQKKAHVSQIGYHKIYFVGRILLCNSNFVLFGSGQLLSTIFRI